MSANNHQPLLFSDAELLHCQPAGPRQQPTLDIDKPSLQRWKQAIATYQQQARTSVPISQGSLFDLAPAPVDGAAIEPFQLDLHSFNFFEWPASRHPSHPCIYFVLDVPSHLVLYVGETCKANQRWKGTHDCKRYVQNYQQIHYQFYQQGVQSLVGITFWWDTPSDRRQRLNLESSLIERWKSPFNKENWRFWGTPFIGEKDK